MTDDFFRARLDGMIDSNHALAVLAQRLPWARMEQAVAPCFARKARSEQLVADDDLFGPTAQVAGGGISKAGRARRPLRLMIALILLKNSFNLSDEELVERFAENVYWQHFAGYEYFAPAPPRRRAMRPRSGAFALAWAKRAWRNCSRPPWRRRWTWERCAKASSSA